MSPAHHAPYAIDVFQQIIQKKYILAKFNLFKTMFDNNYMIISYVKDSRLSLYFDFTFQFLKRKTN